MNSYKLQISFVIVVAIIGCGKKVGKSTDNSDIESRNYASRECTPKNSDGCCDTSDSFDGCGELYGQKTAIYLGFQAYSNGACTGGPSGYYQCALYVQLFWSSRLKHDFIYDNVTKTTWGNAENALWETRNNPNLDDPVFVFDRQNVGWNGTAEAPRETDIIVISDEHEGHVVIVRDGVNRPDSTSINLPIIEENVANKPSNKTDPPCYHRVYKAVWDYGLKRYDISFVSNSTYLGFIRHPLAGIYNDDVSTRHAGSSDKFHDAYMRFGVKIGWGYDNGGSPFVHSVREYLVQDFKNTDPSSQFSADGLSMIVYNSLSAVQKAFLLYGPLYGAYKCIPATDNGPLGGLEALGAPTTDVVVPIMYPYIKVNDDCSYAYSSTAGTTMFQNFDKGCMWVDGAKMVHVHLLSKYSRNLGFGSMSNSCGANLIQDSTVLMGGAISAASADDICTVGSSTCTGTGTYHVCVRETSTSSPYWLDMNCTTGMACNTTAAGASCAAASSATPDAAVAQTTATATTVSTTTSSPECSPNNLIVECGIYSNRGNCLDATKQCVNGKWGACINGHGPEPEICGNGIDEDCDGFDLPCPPESQTVVPEPPIAVVPEPVAEPSIDAPDLRALFPDFSNVDAAVAQAMPEPPPTVPEPTQTAPEPVPEPSVPIVPEPAQAGPEPQQPAVPDAGIDAPLPEIPDAATVTVLPTVTVTATATATASTVTATSIVATVKFAVTAIEDGVSITLVIDPSVLKTDKNNTCIVGNLPRFNWSGKLLVLDADGLARVTIKKSDLTVGMPFLDCKKNALPYRFSFLNCGTSTWYANALSIQEPFLWWGRDDTVGSDGLCACTGGFALGLSSDNALIPGSSYRKNCL